MNMRIPARVSIPTGAPRSLIMGKMRCSNFLIANALYWVEADTMWTACGWTRWHPCCIWIMAKKTGEWVPNKYGGNKNLEAIEFFKHLNTVPHRPESGRHDDRGGIHGLAQGDGQAGGRRPGLYVQVEHGLDA